MSQQLLTLISTSFIVASGLALMAGLFFIKRRRNISAHRAAMLTATGCAAAFLVAYLTRWNLYGSKPFAGEGIWRTIYLANLLPHILMAMLVGPMALRMIYLATRKQDFVAHKKLGRITVPVWLYVAASGWLIYFMLYHMTF
jgi:putative membrane protein